MTQSLFPEGFLWGGALSACQAEVLQYRREPDHS